jgi:hypothetical protein
MYELLQFYKSYTVYPPVSGGVVGGAGMSLTRFHPLWDKILSQNLQAVADQGCHLEGSSTSKRTAYRGVYCNCRSHAMPSVQKLFVFIMIVYLGINTVVKIRSCRSYTMIMGYHMMFAVMLCPFAVMLCPFAVMLCPFAVMI